MTTEATCESDKLRWQREMGLTTTGDVVGGNTNVNAWLSVYGNGEMELYDWMCDTQVTISTSSEQEHTDPGFRPLRDEQ